MSEEKVVLDFSYPWFATKLLQFCLRGHLFILVSKSSKPKHSAADFFSFRYERDLDLSKKKKSQAVIKWPEPVVI